MNFTAAPLAGAFLLDMQPTADARGFFARAFCAGEFAEHGLVAPVSQMSVSFNHLRGTLRGLHFQSAPCEEDKLVRCTRGAVYDVIVDLRSASPTRRGWYGVELTAANHRALYVPKGFAHGFITLEDDTELLYMMSVPHAPEAARGVRWNDPLLGIHWPIEPTLMSDRDAGYPLLDGADAPA